MHHYAEATEKLVRQLNKPELIETRTHMIGCFRKILPSSPLAVARHSNTLFTLFLIWASADTLTEGPSPF
jgi:hypothetical protein